MSERTYQYPCLLPKQAQGRVVASFCAPARDILQFATIDRIGRTENGTLRGFQRPQVSKHINEIRNYLAESDAVLPNSVVVAFTSSATVTGTSDGVGEIRILTNGETCGYIVDGQQRLTALSTLTDKEFEVCVTALICPDEEELRRQFILINNSKPLPKALIYELLPTVERLPDRLSSRAMAARLVERLNFESRSSLHRQIKQHTNPSGHIRDTALQKVLITSLADGMLREMTRRDRSLDSGFEAVSHFFEAVQSVFETDWSGHTPRSSRLVHGAGIVSMGYVMEHLHARNDATTCDDFVEGLQPLVGRTAWTSGTWKFSSGEIRPWNSIQNVARDWLCLSDYLLRILRNNSAVGEKRSFAV